MFAFGLLLFTLAAAVEPIPGYNELLYGFDAVKGITLAQIAPLTYIKGKTWTHPLNPGTKYSVPDQFEVHEDAMEDIRDSYEETLDQWVQTKSTSFGIKIGYAGFLGLNVEYDHAKEQFLTEYKAFHDRTELLGYFQVAPVPGSYDPSALIQAAAKLPESCNKSPDLEKYVSFVKAFGTHYINHLRIGGYMHQEAEFSADLLKKVDKKTVDAEINGAWKGFTAGASVGHVFENDQYSQTNHTTVHFMINGGNIYKKYDDMQDWKSTIPSNPATIERLLSPVSDLLDPKYARCIDAGTRLYLAQNINPTEIYSEPVDTIADKWSQEDLKVIKGYVSTGMQLHFGGSCSFFCDYDGWMIRTLSLIGGSLYGMYPAQEPQTVTVTGKEPAENHTINYVCPANTYLAGMKMSWAGTCKDKCEPDGPVLTEVDLICRTPHLASAPRLLSDAKSTSVPTIKTIPINSVKNAQAFGECPADYMVESITATIAGTCDFKCEPDGAQVTTYQLNCRALSDFNFAF